jgi:23S rRNA (cytosine1962-C5)-methyltransferase
MAEGAVAVVTRRAAERVRAGHLWVYRSGVEKLRPGEGEAEVAGGTLVTVVDGRGIALGTALFSDASEICLRMVSRKAGVGRSEYLAEVRERLGAAIRLREVVAAETFSGDETNACRLVFSEADGLPGIVIDRYNGLVVVQLLTQGTAQSDVRGVAAEVLGGQPWVETVVERPDARMRELERLEAATERPLFTRGVAELRSVFTINGVRFHFDASAGQKTGAFLDQRLNYAAAEQWVARSGATGRALDVCTYQGGFALHLARVCERVTGVDASRAALEVADRNLDLNAAAGSGLRAGPGKAKVDWIEADAF